MPEREICTNLIGGRWTDAMTDRRLEVFNPSSGEVIAHVPLCAGEDVGAAVEAAQRAFGAWRDTPAPDRARIMFRFRELLIRDTDRIAASTWSSSPAGSRRC
jgi:malonate-semialdehyde dehydrogenase (acetylating)/methylmalonate-semialdehyde dehydrogenase